MEDLSTVIVDILEESVWSPSGDNCQPWVFEIKDNSVFIFCDSSRARHILDSGGYASLLALGGLIETIDLVAKTKSLKTDVVLAVHLPIEGTTHAWCEVKFSKAPHPIDPDISHSLKARCTDRRKFHGFDGPLIDRVLSGINAKPEISNLNVRVSCAGVLHVNHVAAIAKCEAALFEIEGAVSSTTKWIRLRQSSAQQSRDGLPVRNLGVSLVEALVFVLVGRFSFLLRLMRPFLKFAVQLKTQKTLMDSTMIGFVVPEVSATSLVSAGRVALQVWVELSKEGYGVQPMTISSLGVVLADCGLFGSLSSATENSFKNADRIARSQWGMAQTGNLIWQLRVGKVRSPLSEESRTLRRRPVISVKRF